MEAEFDDDERNITYVLGLPGSLKYELWLFDRVSVVGEEMLLAEFENSRERSAAMIMIAIIPSINFLLWDFLCGANFAMNTLF